jgi:hypothetical protein
MSDEFTTTFKLPSYPKLVELAEAGTESIIEKVHGVCGPLEYGHGPIGLNLAVGRRQVRYWFPLDHPEFQNIRETLEVAAQRNEELRLLLDPERFILLNAERVER